MFLEDSIPNSKNSVSILQASQSRPLSFGITVSYQTSSACSSINFLLTNGSFLRDSQQYDGSFHRQDRVNCKLPRLSEGDIRMNSSTGCTYISAR